MWQVIDVQNDSYRDARRQRQPPTASAFRRQHAGRAEPWLYAAEVGAVWGISLALTAVYFAPVWMR